MEEAIGTKVKRGGKYCIAGAPKGISCQNTSYTNGISMHKFPSQEETRRRWVKFVRRHRPNFTPTLTLHLCFVHFKPTCFTRRQDIHLDGVSFKKTLRTDAVPTEYCTIVVANSNAETSARERRQVSIPLFSTCSFIDNRNVCEEF